MDRSVKAPGGSDFDEAWAYPIVTAGAGVVAEGVGMSLRIGEALYGGPVQDVPWNPVALGIGLATGDLAWTGAATGGAVTLVAGVAASVVGSVWAYRAVCRKCSALYRNHRQQRELGRIRAERVDAQAQWMARGAELADMERGAVAAKAAELQVQLGEGDEPGVMIARAVVDGRVLYGSYEDLHLDIWGPRSGKTTGRVIPAVMDAVGAVVATSNKRDVVDATRAARGDLGRVRVFDPQGVAAEDCTWFWNPLEWVLDGGPIAQERAMRLAEHFSAGGDADAARDAFFDPEGEDLLAGLLLAAALAGEPITKVFEWVTRSDDQEPIQILDTHGYPLLAGALSDQYYAPDKQRGGVFSTAKKMASCLKLNTIHPWVCPPRKGEPARESLDVAEFVCSRDTLYLLSKEGKGTAGPLITALAAAIAEDADIEGTRHPRGRLPVPLTIVLDEAANIVKWAQLPKQYSHFGSRGIVVMTILQSWSQGVRCWGSDGMNALWSASNIKVLGAGLDDAAFLRDRSELIGSHYELIKSISRSRNQGSGSFGSGSVSTSVSRTTEVTLHASDLAALPKGRVVVFASGHRPFLGQTVPWMERPYADRVRAGLGAAETVAATRIRPRLRVVATAATPEGLSA